MKMRKIIALFSAVMMLCAIIPMSVSAATSDVTTNFDDGSKNGWSGPTVSADAAYAGAYGATATATGSWGSLLKKTVSLEAYTSYKLSFWYKSNADAVTNAAFEMKDPNNAKVPLLNKAGTSVTLSASTTAWTQMELYFTTGDYTDVQFLFYRGSSSSGDAASICVDEIVLEEVTAETDGYIVDGGFESGTMNFTPNAAVGSITTDAHSGSYAVTGASATKYDIYAQKYVRVEKNTDYTFTFWAKASESAKLRLYVNAKKFYQDSSKDLRGTYSTHTISTGWAQYEVTFNSGDNTEVALSLCSSGASATFYLDDLALAGPNNITPDEPDEPGSGTPYEPVEGNLLQNPSIETGTDSGWTYSGTVATNELAHSGSYSLKSTNNSGAEWKSMVKQAVSVTANTDYTLSFWYYYAGEQTDVSFYAMANDPSGSSIVSNHVKNITPYTWAQVTCEFNSGENTSVTVYAKNGTASSTGCYYFDDFVLVANGSTEPEQPDNPSGGTEDPVPGNLIKEGTFENGSKTDWTFYNGTAVSTDAAYKGSYGVHAKGSSWNGIAHTTVNTEVGKSYQLSFWYKINVAGFNWKITGVVSGTQYGGYWQNTNLGTWQQIVLEFVADDTAVKLNFSGLDETSSPDFYLDTVSIIEIQGPSNDGFIVNGDFEVGKTIGWEVHQSTAISADAAHNSNYGMHLVGDGGWGGLLNQTFATTKGLKYTLTLDVKVNSYGVNMKVCNTADKATLAYQWITGTEWATYTYTFTAVSDSCYINFNGGGSGAEKGLHEDVYVDNISIVEIPCEHEWDSEQDADCNICGQIREVPFVVIMAANGTSASDSVNGLAFRFDIEAYGAAIDHNNKYTGTATVKPYGNSDEYSLVAMGAVVTNKAANGTEAMLNLNTVNGKSVIDIEAVYLLETADSSASFAARIVNIPADKADTEIYARPYYVFEKDGAEIVIYGDIVSNNYAAVIG